MQRIFLNTNRFYSDVAKYPKITTHYTVHPRESDSRWKGKKEQIISCPESKVLDEILVFDRGGVQHFTKVLYVK